MNKQAQLTSFPVLLLCLLLSSSTWCQGWERIYFTQPNPDLDYTSSAADHVFAQDDGSFLFACHINGSPRWLYTDSNGMMTNLTSANYTGPFLIRANDQNFVHAARTGTSSPPEQDVFVRKFDLDGNILWTHFPPGNLFGNEAVSDLLQTADGDYVITGAPAYMTRLNENGDVAWKTVLPDPEEDNIYQYLAVQLEDGSFFMAASSAWFTTNNPLMTHAAHIDAAGNRLWFGSLEADVQIEQMVVAADGNIVVIGRNPDYNFVLVKLDNNGNTIWEIEIPNAIYPLAYTGDLLVTMDGGFALLANSQGTEEDVYLIKMDSEGSIEWSQTYGGPFRDNGQDLLQLPDGGYVIGGGANGTGEDQSTYLIRTDELGNAASGLIQGQVQYDTDENCILSPDEQALENWIVSAENSTGLFYASVAADGSYAIEVTPGEYTVTLNVPNEYWMVCTNEVQVSAMDTVAVDFAVQSIEQCPLMEVQIQNYGLRLCEPATMNVLCRNLGTSLAEDVSVDIEFDDDLEIISASVPFSPVGINTYNFTLGDIDFLQQSTFTVEVVTGCDIVLLGQSLCVEAYVYPDSSCLAPNDLWSGASIAASASCEGDEVHLVLENIGEAAMQQELRYTVIEDHVIMLEDVPFGPLEPGQSVLLPRVADGTFYRIESEQAAFHPGTSMPSAFIEACGENAAGEISLGFVNQHPLDDADYFLDINCTEVVAAYDPNAKRALPQGYETAHYIEPNTRITYQLHFQNTGTAPANEVILLDQLSPHLDPTTVEVGVSSHFYEFDMLRDGTLRFTFPDIQLPDSTANEPESHGYVQFSVAQQDDVELGTVIENTAAIYFDFNPAIWTNTTFHTIGRDFIFVEADEIAESPLQVQVFPNPFQEEVTILVERTDLESLNFLLFDSSGRKILSRSFSGNRVQIDGTAWPAGIYFYQINSAQGLIGSGKMIAK